MSYNPNQKRHAKGSPAAGAWAPDNTRGSAAVDVLEPGLAKISTRQVYGSYRPYAVTEPPVKLEDQIEQLNELRSEYTLQCAHAARQEAKKLLGKQWEVLSKQDPETGVWQPTGFWNPATGEHYENDTAASTHLQALEGVSIELEDWYCEPLDNADILQIDTRLGEEERVVRPTGRYAKARSLQLRDEIAIQAVDLGYRMRHETWSDLVDAGYPDARVTMRRESADGGEANVRVESIIDRDGSRVYSARGATTDADVQNAVYSIEERYEKVFNGDDSDGRGWNNYIEPIPNLDAIVENAETHGPAGITPQRRPLNLLDINYVSDHYPNQTLLSLP